MSPAASVELDSEWSRNTETQTDHGNPPKRIRNNSYGGTSQELGLMRDGAESGIPRFIGSGSGIHFIRTVYEALARQTNPIPNAWGRESGNLVPGEDDQLVSHSPDSQSGTPGVCARLWRRDEIIDEHIADASGVGFDGLVAWTRSYFENWHPAFPFLHGPEVLKLLEKVATEGIASASATDAAIVRAIISISLADKRQTGGKHTTPPSSLVFASLDEIASNLVFVLGSPASLKNIQAAVSVQLFLVSMLKFNMASRLGGAIVRMAFHLGLHRCPYRYPNFDRHEADMRKRLWWSMYCLERMLCQSLGLPLHIRDDDVDVCYATEEMHRAAGHEVPADHASSASKLHFSTLLSKQARVRGMILELRNKNLDARQDTVEHAFLVQGQLSKWANEVHDVEEGGALYGEEMGGQGDQEGRSSGNDAPITPARRALLEIMKHESTITLNRPLLAAKQETPASQAAFQACIAASRAIIDIMDNSNGKGLVSGTPTSHMQVVMLWPLMTWSVWMSCFILTYAALEGVTTVSSAQRSARRTFCILKKLASRGTAWPDSCAHAVEHLVSALAANQNNANDLYTERRSTLKTRSIGHRYASNVERSSFNFNFNDRSSGRQITPRSLDPAITNTMTSSAPDGGLGLSGERTSQNGPLQSAQTSCPQSGVSPANFQPSSALNGSSLPENVPFWDMPVEDWMDPLNALDFSYFAQTGSSDSTMGLGFF